MSINPLDPESSAGQGDRVLRRGHGTRALGPSDSSDSGADIQGAASEIGDAGLDSDTDRYGTGERSGATPDTERRDGADISPDRVEHVDDDKDDKDDKPKPR